MTRAGTATVAVGLLAAALAAGRSSAEELSATAIVARNVAARGGLDAWRKVDTSVWIGHVESDHAPLPVLQFELEQKRPNKTRLVIVALGEKSVRAFDGVHGWKLRGSRGRPEVQPYTREELRFAQSAHGIDGPLIDHAAKGNSVTLAGLDEIGGRKAYHLVVHLGGGGTEDVWVDADTFLDVRYDRIADGPDGSSRRVSTTYSDYRTVDGLQVPFLIETGGGPGVSPDRMRLEKVVLNVPLGDSTFANPADPRALARPRVTIRGAAPSVSTAASSGDRGAARP